MPRNLFAVSFPLYSADAFPSSAFKVLKELSTAY